MAGPMRLLLLLLSSSMFAEAHVHMPRSRSSRPDRPVGPDQPTRPPATTRRSRPAPPPRTTQPARPTSDRTGPPRPMRTAAANPAALPTANATSPDENIPEPLQDLPPERPMPSPALPVVASPGAAMPDSLCIWMACTWPKSSECESVLTAARWDHAPSVSNLLDCMFNIQSLKGDPDLTRDQRQQRRATRIVDA